jgi:hypothetical protein
MAVVNGTNDCDHQEEMLRLTQSFSPLCEVLVKQFLN